MQQHPLELAHAWLTQAQSDLDDAGYLAERGSHAAACFASQQAAEKALKGLLIWHEGDKPYTHVIAELLAALHHHDAPLAQNLREITALDAFYVATRYPDAIAGAVPAASYHCAESTVAREKARTAVIAVGARLPKPP